MVLHNSRAGPFIHYPLALHSAQAAQLYCALGWGFVGRSRPARRRPICNCKEVAETGGKQGVK